MAENTYSSYVLEVLEQVTAHTKQLVENGKCVCCHSYEPEEQNLGQYNCIAVNRLNSIMRGEPQNYEIAPEVHIYQFIWKSNTNPNDPTDYSAPF
jgi:hypothetical protein